MSKIGNLKSEKEFSLCLENVKIGNRKSGAVKSEWKQARRMKS